jgi:hypothetical protein
MKIGLLSNYVDYYDHWFIPSFEAADVQFSRMNDRRWPKWMQIKILRDWGFRTPETAYLYPYEPVNIYTDKIVLYDDPYVHNGEGKKITTLADAKTYNPYLIYGDIPYLMEYQESLSDAGNPISYRYLSIGGERFYLSYESLGKDSWQSNVGSEVEIKLLEFEEFSEYTKVPYEPWTGLDERLPLFAIDFLRSEKRAVHYAVDFNVAPGLRGTPIEDMFSGSMVYQLIERWYEAKQRRDGV